VLYVDSRAGSKDLVRYPPIDKLGELTTLNSADVQFIGNGPGDEPYLIGVEVKSVGDLLGSAATGRLQADDGQLARMAAEYNCWWLCVYGDVACGQRGQLQIRGKWGKYFDHKVGNNPVKYGYLDALVIELAVRGVKVVRLPSANGEWPLAETAQWLGVLYAWWQKEWHEHKLVRAFNKANDIPMTPGLPSDVYYRAGVASKLLPGRGGIGYERAVAAAQHFSSVIEMVGADAREWQRVPGIGKTLARAVVDAVK
jgi:hypothetical protein